MEESKDLYVARPFPLFAQQFTGDIDSAASIREGLQYMSGVVVSYEAHVSFEKRSSVLMVHDSKSSYTVMPEYWVVGDPILETVIVLSADRFNERYMPMNEHPWE